MSELTLSISDGERSIHGCVALSDAIRIVGSLAADPETIAELELALGRFRSSAGSSGFFEPWCTGLSHDAWDAGLVFIDLPGRLIASQTSHGAFESEGAIEWHDGELTTDRLVPFHIAADWMFLDRVHGFEPLAAQRRLDRSAVVPLDERAVIYGQVADFIVREFAARQHELGRLDHNARYELAREIHTHWLLTPREDLRDHAPRDLMIDARYDHITKDLQYQAHRWSLVGEAPPGIARESMAYRFGGFGTHEFVLYYDLVREMITACINRPASNPVNESLLAAEVEHLQMMCQEWLNCPNHDDLHGRTPASVIDRERRRLPESSSAEEAIIDHDCPLCQMMADSRFGPTFWHLDGCNMDDDFAFSLCRSRDEWAAEQREFDEVGRTLDLDLPDAPALGEEIRDLDSGPDESSSVWKTSYSNTQAVDALPARQALPLMLFAIAAHLGELLEDLKSGDASQEQAQSIRAQFTELRIAVSAHSSLEAESAIAHFCEALEVLTGNRPDLEPKCDDLASKLEHLLERCREANDLEEQLPY